ncbi:hypothetical protein PIROE2DRAFT_61916 [Piromyces sp. E2]|nr:hypothetical protein PIROE2DRAFT_61916 [Piromyces sp. E2]|eukprot:OUM62398.1 hypothetical protein PIROE2DRAFT_61916 [Piromyces sp. E2]
MNIYNSHFTNNEGLNGGALYLSNNEKPDTNDAEISMKNVYFNNNKANSFGGAIYSDYNDFYLTDAINIRLINNTAEIAGGALYSPSHGNKTLLYYEDLYLESNIGKSHGNDISSPPSYILSKNEYNNTITISSGSYLSFVFNIYDENNNILKDNNNYFTFISVNSVINSTQNNGYFQITGKECNFYYGECQLNKLKILAQPGQYSLKFEIDNFSKFNTKIKIEEEYKLIITKCKDNEIGIYSRNGLLSCEVPICYSNCPIGTSASCISLNTTYNINSPKYNMCTCYEGYTGNDCDQKIFIDIR